MDENQRADPGVVWKGRPSIGSYAALYGTFSLVAIALLEGLELWARASIAALSPLLSTGLSLGVVTIPYAVEVVTAAVVLVLYLVRVVRLLLLRASNSYELHPDGLYINRGIANLQNTFISAMAFSDAKLVRTVGMRVVGRSLILVEANDGRKFELRMIKDGLRVQGLIRENLAHPTVRVEK